MNSKNNSPNLSHLRGGKGWKIMELVRNSLREDIGRADITTELILSQRLKVRAGIVLKETAVVAGLEIAKKVFKTVNKNIKFQAKCADGSLQKSGSALVILEGDARSILSAERTALNFLSHLSGIATLTYAFVQKVRPYNVKIMDTRKTIPGLRALQKYAVKMGGGYNHRMGLWDGVLIKDNHIFASRLAPCALRLRELVEIAKKKKPKNMKVEIEVKNLKEFEEALRAQPDIIMLDNMKIADIRKAVMIRRMRDEGRKTKIEVSGGVTLDNVREIAKTGVDMISIGALTHSAQAIDMSLEVFTETKCRTK